MADPPVNEALARKPVAVWTLPPHERTPPAYFRLFEDGRADVLATQGIIADLSPSDVRGLIAYLASNLPPSPAREALEESERDV